MSFHEQHPWAEPQRGFQVHGRVILGVIFAVVVWVFLALMELPAAMFFLGLTVVTAVAFVTRDWIYRHHHPV